MCCCAEAPCTADGPPWPKHTECNSGQTSCNTQCEGKQYKDTCDVTCKSGYTQSAPGSSKATYLCAANGRQPKSLWTGSLTCDKVDCGDFPAAPTSPGAPNVRVWENVNCLSNLFYDGDTDGQCSATCIDGFYENPKDAAATRTTKKSYCRAPGPGAGLGNPTGVWTPRGTAFLDCRPGELSASKSTLVDSGNDKWLKEGTPQSIYSGKVDQLQEAAKFGPGKGPIYTFDIIAKDVQGNPRNYHNLGRGWDYLVLKIERVPLQMLPEDEQKLQPQQTLNLPTFTDKYATGTWSGGTSRTYRKTITSGPSNNNEEVTFFVREGTDGRWRVSHQFEEHGVFYVSAFLCRNEDATREACDDADASRLVPKTGATGLSGTNIETRAFTICPQNTRIPDQNGFILGSRLGECQALPHCFSPLGPGRIAGFCPVGFQCQNPGTTWPLAEPGHWVSSTYPVQTTKCLTLGACPGSLNLNAECPHIAQAGELWPVSNFEASKLTTVGADPCFTYLPPQGSQVECPSGPCLEYTWESCKSVVGSRCCLGNTGKKSCESCCKASQGPPDCDNRQWHPISTPEGTHCEPCPPVEFNFVLVLSVTVLLIILAPILVKLTEIAKHAGAIQGPLLSMVNFFQSSSLFVGLRGIHWPEEFKVFARSIADLFNFNIVPLLHYLKKLSFGLIDIPPLDCAWTMSYSLKFVLVMLTPGLLAISIVLVQYAWLCWLVLWSNRLRVVHGCFCHFVCCRRMKRKKATSFMSVQLLQQDGDNMIETPGMARDAKVAEIKAKEVEIRQLSKLANNRSTQYVDSEVDAVGEAVRKLKTMKAKFEVDFGQPYPESLWRVMRDHDTGKTLATVKRCCIGYLMVGYIFLAGTALEPLSCQRDFDGREYMTAAPEIECSWCNTEYVRLRIGAYVGSTFYGFGSPILFLTVLWRSKQKRLIKSNNFTYGFLSTKMREEYYAWEVVISFRKLLLVVGTKLSSEGSVVPATLWNMCVTVAAFGMQVCTWPFAEIDANWAESLTLMSTLLVLILGVGQMASVDENDLVATDNMNTVLQVFDMCVYVCLGGIVLSVLFILGRRVSGMCFNMKHRNDCKTTKIEFARASWSTRKGCRSLCRIRAEIVFWRLRSSILCHRIDRYRYNTQSVLRWRSSDEFSPTYYMATAQIVVYKSLDSAAAAAVRQRQQQRRSSQAMSGAMSLPECLQNPCAVLFTKQVSYF